ncbi:adenylyltransferase/cytidyltransferase family protein [Candidatus Peregrinibacteria bacterium]|jgi:nicotinamide-nucleotide adenylyltransferase|nr:adenylyltransferase/cytidyltransferase family protein [Candidatus Peregrinibacteria bacterium]
MEEKIPSLFIGRFQPFHIGHLSDIKNIISKGEFCTIVIAAANKSGTWRNPLTGDQRGRILTETLAAETDLSPDSYKIMQLPDIDDDKRWASYVVDSVPPFKKIYSGSAFVRSFFEKNSRFETLPVTMIPDGEGDRLRATTIRNKALAGKSYDHFLHPRTKEILDELAFRDLLVKISEQS